MIRAPTSACTATTRLTRSEAARITVPILAAEFVRAAGRLNEVSAEQLTVMADHALILRESFLRLAKAKQKGR